MNTLKRLFAYLLIVLFISIFFQSIVILFIKYSKEEPGVALTQKFQNTFLNTGDKDKKDGASGAGHLLKTLSNVVSTLSEERDGAAPDKMIISVQRSSQIEEYRPQTELNSPFFEEKIELKPVRISSQQASPLKSKVDVAGTMNKIYGGSDKVLGARSTSTNGKTDKKSNIWKRFKKWIMDKM